MKDNIKRHYLGWFYGITMIFSFVLLPLNFVFPSVGKYSVFFTQFAPAFGVVFIACILKDKMIFSHIKSDLYLQKSSIKWIVPTLLIPVICIAVTSLLLTLLKIAFISWKGNTLFYILNIAAIMIGAFTEEMGWRGFLLPRLQKRYSPFVSSIAVGVLWGVWHLNFIAGILGFILYIITIIEMSILMTWLYNKTNGNLFLMTLWHFAFNVASHIFLWERFGMNLYIVESIVFGIVCVAILISSKKVFFTKPMQIEPS